MVVAGLGDTGVLVATRLARSCDVAAISTRPALVSGQELGSRLATPDRWRRTYLVTYRRFRRLDQVRSIHGRITAADLDAHEVHVETAEGETQVEPYDVLVIATGASNGFWRHDRVEDLAAIEAELEGESPAKPRRKRTGCQPLPPELPHIELRYEPDMCADGG